jgi:hypothetical protein
MRIWILWLVLAVPAFAERVELNFDFDDNLFFTDAKIHPKNTKTGKQASLTTQEWAASREQMGQPGKWQDFTAGEDSFREVGDTTAQGAGLFPHQIKRALSRSKDQWQGPAWKAFVRALGNPETRSSTGIITARRHAVDSTYAALKVLLDQGLLPALPDKENLFVVMDPAFPAEFQAPTIPERKAKVMVHLLDRLDKIPLPPGATRTHLWGFSDDDYGNILAAEKTLGPHVAAKRWPHTKVLLEFTGLTHPLEKPRCEVLATGGKPRPCTGAERSASFKVP